MYSIYIQQVSLGIPEEMHTIDNFEIQCVIYMLYALQVQKDGLCMFDCVKLMVGQSQGW